mgnify:CR=1 FL=1
MRFILLLLLIISFRSALNAQTFINESKVDSLPFALTKTNLANNLKNSPTGEVYFLIAQLNEGDVKTVYLLTPSASGMDTSKIEDSDFIKIKQHLLNLGKAKLANLVVPLLYVENPRRSAFGYLIYSDAFNRIFSYLYKITNNLDKAVVFPAQVHVSFPMTRS